MGLSEVLGLGEALGWTEELFELLKLLGWTGTGFRLDLGPFRTAEALSQDWGTLRPGRDFRLD